MSNIQEPPATITHQSLRKGELQLLTGEFETRTLQMLNDLERSTITELQRRMITSQLGKRFEQLVRLQSMRLTVTSNDWAAHYKTWVEVMP